MTDQERLDNVEKLFLAIREAIPFGDWVKYGISDDMNTIMDNLRILHGESEKDVDPNDVIKSKTENLMSKCDITALDKKEAMVISSKFMSDYCNTTSCSDCPLYGNVCCSNGSVGIYHREPWEWYDGHHTVPEKITNPSVNILPYYVAPESMTDNPQTTISNTLTMPPFTAPDLKTTLDDLIQKGIVATTWKLLPQDDSDMPRF